MTSVDATTNSTEEPLHCFVCDVAVTGRHYTLATCRTQSTKIRLIEKLGQLVGERYMVVICEDDIICRGCANLINTLDRLETEMGSVRSVVLRFLEKKYSLEEGELLNNKASGIGLPPQITPSGNLSSRLNTGENFMYRKRKAALSDLENEENNMNINKTKKLNSKNDVWMQCDKCKYTTNYNSFMTHHVRQHVKKKKGPECEYCGEEVDGNSIHQCRNKKVTDVTVVTSGCKASARGQESESSNSVGGNLKMLSQSVNSLRRSTVSQAETVEMIAAEINELPGSDRNLENSGMVMTDLHGSMVNSNLSETSQVLSVCESTEQSKNTVVTQSDALSEPLINRNEEMIIPITEMSQEQVQQQLAAGNIEVNMENEEGSTPTAICVMEMSENNAANESTLVTVQKMEDDSNAVYVQVVEMGKEGDISENSNVPKVLTLSDDGTVEMVEVMWDEMVTSDVATAQSLQF